MSPFFASKTGFANPIFGVENVSNTKFKRVEALIEKKIERTSGTGITGNVRVLIRTEIENYGDYDMGRKRR